MSVQIASPDTYTCSREECEEEYESPQTGSRSYCSPRCRYLDTGEKRLRDIRLDHRFCAGCLRRTKKVEKPPANKSVTVGPVDHEGAINEYEDVLVGFQYLTPNAEIGQREGRAYIFDPEAERAEPNYSASDTHIIRGTICTCGTTDLTDEWMRENMTDLTAAAERLCRIFEWQAREGQHDDTLDPDVLLQTLKRSAEIQGTPHWPLAVGRAIER